MALSTASVTLPSSVSFAIVEKAKGTSTIAKLSPADSLSGFVDDKYNVFTGASEAEVVAEGSQKGAYDQPIVAKEGKRFTVQTTTRVSKQLQWADESDQLQILDAIQADQTAALARALDIVVYHGVNPINGEALDGYTGLAAQATQVTPTTGKDLTVDIDALTDAVIDSNINGIALSSKYAAALRKLRVSATGARLYPEIPLAVTNTGTLDGIPAAVSTTVAGAKGHDTGVLAFVGDFSTIRWRLARPITAEVIPYGDPDGTGDLARSNQLAYRTEAVFSFAVLDPTAIAVLKPAATPNAKTAKAAK